MLKPKRKTFRKEMERDPFLDSLLSAKSFIDQNKKRYIKIFGFGITAMLVFLLYLQNQVSNQDAAESLLSKGMMYLEQGDEQNAMIHFQNLVDEYGSTSAGETAGYYIGRIHFDQSEFELAQPYFENFISDGKNRLLKGTASQVLANIYLKKGELVKAIDYQKKAVKNAFSDVESANASIRLAKLYKNNGKIEEAAKILNGLLDEHKSNFEVHQRIDEALGQTGIIN